MNKGTYYGGREINMTPFGLSFTLFSGWEEVSVEGKEGNKKDSCISIL